MNSNIVALGDHMSTINKTSLSLSQWNAYNFGLCLNFLRKNEQLFFLGSVFLCSFIYTGNIGNVPLVLIAALCRDKSNPFGDSVKCAQDGNAYISFGQWVSYAILFSSL